MTEPAATAEARAPEGEAPVRGGPGTIVYYRLPHPLRDGQLLLFDQDRAEAVLDAARGGAAVERLAVGGAMPPDEREVRQLEARWRRRLVGAARRATGKAIFYLLLGPALALLWVNFAEAVAALFFWFPPLAVLIATHGAISGGLLLAVVVGLLPVFWAWRRAWRHLAEARRWGRLARVLGSRRFRDSALHLATDPGLAALEQAAGGDLDRLREAVKALEERGADGAGEAAALARSLYRACALRGFPLLAGVFHDLYRRFDVAEQRVTRLEQGASGVLAERKAGAELQRARRESALRLAPYSPAARASAHSLAPAAGALAGAAALAFAFLLTGTFWVEPDQAVIVDPPSARLARLAGALGLSLPADAFPPNAVQVVRDPGFNWGWPLPFAARHAITLGEQRLTLRAVFRQTGPNRYDVVFMEVRFRISDVPRWAQRDRDGHGVDRLAGELSSFLQDVLQRSRQEARRVVAQQNPSLADDPAQLAARADQLVEARLDDLMRAFVNELGNSSAARDAGIQVSRDARWQLVRGVPGEIAGVSPVE
jgi:hypothetical protein